MTRWLLLISATSLLVSLAPACAGTYSVSLPLAGRYPGHPGPPPADARLAVADFGFGFQQIQSVAIHWSGVVHDGLYWWRFTPDELTPFSGCFLARLNVLYGTDFVADGSEDGVPFDTVRQFGRPDQWTSLYGGSIRVWVYVWDMVPTDAVIVSGGDGELYSAELIVEGTPVPEPAPLLPFAIGLVGMSLRRRR